LIVSDKATIAELLGWSIATVHALHSRWANEGDAIFSLRARGGRHKRHLSPEQELQLLAPFVERALANGLFALEANPSRTQPIMGFNWTTSMSLNALGTTGAAGRSRNLDRVVRSLAAVSPLWRLVWRPISDVGSNQIEGSTGFHW
jgi:transposase